MQILHYVYNNVINFSFLIRLCFKLSDLREQRSNLEKELLSSEGATAPTTGLLPRPVSTDNNLMSRWNIIYE